MSMETSVIVHSSGASLAVFEALKRYADNHPHFASFEMLNSSTNKIVILGRVNYAELSAIRSDIREASRVPIWQSDYDPCVLIFGMEDYDYDNQLVYRLSSKGKWEGLE